MDKRELSKKILKTVTPQKPDLADLSPELLCNIFQYLSLKEVIPFSMLSRKMVYAIDLHLRLRKSIDFCEGKVYAFMPTSITDDSLHSLLKKCPQLEFVYGLHPVHVDRRRLRKRSTLTVPGIIDALGLCPCLKAIETSDLKLLEAVMQNLPHLEIIGQVQNRDAIFPPHASQRFRLQPYPKITSLNLVGVEVPELTAMPHLQHLYLQCVRFTKLQPFRAFIAQNLQTFVMKHCIGPSLSLRYLSLIIALSSSPFLHRLELVRVPLPGGLFQRAVEDSYRHNGFVNLTTLAISGCKGVLEADIGHLMIVASKNIKHLYIQPSLTKDSLFVSLSFAQCSFPKLKTLYLGYVDELHTAGEWSNEALRNQGLAEVPDTPASLTDSGMKVIGQLFSGLETLSISSCPHLILMEEWYEGETGWQKLLDLTLQRCHCLRLSSFSSFLSTLPKLEVLILVDMFREPPKGCSHVGLSAGTGLGMSSAVVSNQDEHIAVQGHQQDFEPQADENVLENEDIDPFPEVENERFPEPHLIVLEQDLFDEQDHNEIEERDFIPKVEHPLSPNSENIAVNVIEDPRLEQNNSNHRTENEKNIEPEENPIAPSSFGVLNPEVKGLENGIPLCGKIDSPSSSGLSLDPGANKKGKRKSAIMSGTRQAASKTKKICLLPPSIKKKDVEAETSSQKSSGDLNKEFQSSNDAGNKVYSDPFDCRICDPSQPSTSTATCCHAFAASPDPLVDHIKSEDVSNAKLEENKRVEPSHKILISKIFDDECSPIKVKQEIFSDEEQECKPMFETTSVKRDSVKNLQKNNSYTGPMTRHRRRVLDNEIDMMHDSLKSNEKYVKRQKKRKVEVTVQNTELNFHNMKPISDFPQFQPCRILLPRISINDYKNSKVSTNCENENETCNQNSFSVGDVSNSHPASIKNEPVDGIENEEHPNNSSHLSSTKQNKTSDNSTIESVKTKSPVKVSVKVKRKKSKMRFFVSQGTQATSDIRRFLRRTRRRRRPFDRSANTPGGCVKHLKRHSVSRRIRHKYKRPVSSSTKKVNKATSTSDPLLEEDAVQILRLASETLRSLTVVSCGLSDIIINRSNQLMHIEVQACRILKSCQVYFCPALKKFSISQCPKLSFETIFPYILELETYGHLMVSFEPWNQNYDPGEAENGLFYAASLDQNIILCEDYTYYPEEIFQTFLKNSLLAWMDSIDSLVHHFGLSFEEPKAKPKLEDPVSFPWGHDLKRVLGAYEQVLPDHDNKPLHFELLTNNHVFAQALELFSWEKGFPQPEKNTLFANLRWLCEALRKVLRMQRRMKTFYIPVNILPQDT